MTLRHRTLTIALGLTAFGAATPAFAGDFTIAPGQTVNERLSRNDAQLADGEHFDRFSFNGKAGDQVVIDMQSGEFDTYLMLVRPDGDDSIQNDDFNGSTNSSLSLTLPQTGTYVIWATSYAGYQRGRYTLSLSMSGSRGSGVPTNGGSDGDLFGVFVGMSDYPGDANDLPYCADDAADARRALIDNAGMRREHGILLQDGEATIDNLYDAISRLAPMVGPGDTFVFFFSGHGNQVAARSGDFADAHDGLDETIELYDGSVRDHELARMLDAINRGTSMVVLDSCYSGGFDRDVISAPGRIGLFSSQEDMVSMVAAEYKAGGYLSHFFREAFDGAAADADADDRLTVFELTDFLHESFRDHVVVTTAGTMLGNGEPMHQHLVADRGGVSPLEVVFELD